MRHLLQGVQLQIHTSAAHPQPSQQHHPSGTGTAQNSPETSNVRVHRVQSKLQTEVRLRQTPGHAQPSESVPVRHLLQTVQTQILLSDAPECETLQGDAAEFERRRDRQHCPKSGSGPGPRNPRRGHPKHELERFTKHCEMLF